MSKEYKPIPGYPVYKVSDNGAVRNVKDNSPVAITAGNTYLIDDADGKRQRVKKEDLIEKAWGKKPEEKVETKTSGMGGAAGFVEERAARGRQIRMPEHKPAASKVAVPKGDIKSKIPDLPKAKKEYPQYVQDILGKDISKSEKIRLLHKKEITLSEIAGLIGNGYGFIYNVIHPPKKKGVLNVQAKATSKPKAKAKAKPKAKKKQKSKK